MSDLLSLAERCEQATGPDRWLDALIGAAVNQLPIGCEGEFLETWPHPFQPAQFVGSIAAPGDDGGTVCHWEARSFTASLDDAMQLKPDGWHVGVLTECDEDDAPHCCLTENDEPCRDAVGDGPNMVLSLCAAALRARSAMESNTNG